MHREDVAPHLNDLSQHVIAAAIEVHRVLGPGFQEQTYHRALAVELRKQNMGFAVEVPVALTYKSEPIGEGRIDILVENELVVELKATEGVNERFRRQVLAYLKAKGLTLGLLLNFEANTIRDGMLRIVNAS